MRACVFPWQGTDNRQTGTHLHTCAQGWFERLTLGSSASMSVGPRSMRLSHPCWSTPPPCSSYTRTLNSLAHLRLRPRCCLNPGRHLRQRLLPPTPLAIPLPPLEARPPHQQLQAPGPDPAHPPPRPPLLPGARQPAAPCRSATARGAASGWTRACRSRPPRTRCRQPHTRRAA